MRRYHLYNLKCPYCRTTWDTDLITGFCDICGSSYMLIGGDAIFAYPTETQESRRSLIVTLEIRE